MLPSGHAQRRGQLSRRPPSDPGNEPTSFAIDPSTNQVLTTNFLDGTLSYFTAPS